MSKTSRLNACLPQHRWDADVDQHSGGSYTGNPMCVQESAPLCIARKGTPLCMQGKESPVCPGASQCLGWGEVSSPPPNWGDETPVLIKCHCASFQTGEEWVLVWMCWLCLPFYEGSLWRCRITQLLPGNSSCQPRSLCNVICLCLCSLSHTHSWGWWWWSLSLTQIYPIGIQRNRWWHQCLGVGEHG